MSKRKTPSDATLIKERRLGLSGLAIGKKYILDGLVMAGVLTNDGMKQIEGFTDTFIPNSVGQVIIDLVEV